MASRVGRCGLACVGVGLVGAQGAAGSVSSALVVCVALQLSWLAVWLADERRRLDGVDLSDWRASIALGGWYLIWLPGGYGGSVLYLVHHHVNLGLPMAVGLGVVGALALAGAGQATAQLRRLRDEGSIQVWGRPAEVVGAGEHALLASGWWSVSRHFGFVLQWTVVVCWSLTALFGHALPYLAAAALALVQLVRAFRIDASRAARHGGTWTEYCRRVPYKLLPGVL